MPDRSQERLPFSDFEKIERTFYFRRLLTNDQMNQVKALKYEDEKKIMVARFIKERACAE